MRLLGEPARAGSTDRSRLEETSVVFLRFGERPVRQRRRPGEEKAFAHDTDPGKHPKLCGRRMAEF
jgi:hypothetical protein